MNFLILQILLLSCTLTVIHAFLLGAPLSACDNYLPLHRNTNPSTSHLPYEIYLVPGIGRIHITLGSREGLPFKGFIINARDVESGSIIGEFVNLPDSVQAIRCPPGTLPNTITHTNNTAKQNIEFDWIAPENYEGTVIFNSTFVHDYATYWLGVESARVTVLKGAINVMSTLAPPTTERISTTPYYDVINTADSAQPSKQHPIYEGCGVTKNCFGSSDGCVESSSCNGIVAVEVKGERYLFEALGVGGKYIAVGLSNDDKMGEDSVVECTEEDGQMKIHMSWNSGKSNRRIALLDGAITLESKSIEDGILYCKFSRNKTTMIEGYMYDLSNQPYYLLLAAGDSLEANGVGYHDRTYVASAKSQRLADIGVIAAADNLFIRIHGALMIASWIGTASVGMLMARYYKQTWLGSRLCGKDQWFAWHRFLMILTWSMTIAGFVIIFVELGEWSSETIHASLGLTSTILAFIQPFMAALRPHPGTPRRPLFNWAHWFVGNISHISAIIAIFFAVRLNKAKIPEWVDWILTAYVIFHVITHIVLSLASCISDRQDNQSINAFPMKDMHLKGSTGRPDISRDAPFSGLRKFIFGIYFIIILIITIILIIIVVMAPIEQSWENLRNAMSTY